MADDSYKRVIIADVLPGITEPLTVDLAAGAEVDLAAGAAVEATLADGASSLGTVLVPDDVSDEDAVAVDDTAGGTTLLAAKANRQYLLVQNLAGSDTIYLRVDGSTAPTTSNGRALAAGEGHEWLASGGVVPKGAIKAICAAAETASVYVLEG